MLVNWFNNSWTSVKWHSAFSCFIKIEFGVRQGSVLSPSLLAIYLNDIISLLPLTQRYCIILYADDTLIIAPSVSELQNIVNICERELNRLDMTLNVNKKSELMLMRRATASV